MTAKKRPPLSSPVVKVKIRTLPPMIPDTPESVAQAIVNTRPKRREEWNYLKEQLPKK